MSKEVLVAIDGSEQAEDALEHAMFEFPDADITALTAVDPIAAGYAGAPAPDALGTPTEWNDHAKEHADEVLQAAEEQAEEAGRTVKTVSVSDRPARSIVDYAEENDVDHVVIGSHGRTGVSRILLGSVAETVVRRAPCPVTVVR